MANPRGIFTLRNLVLQTKLGEAVPNSEVFIQAAAVPNTNYGYFSGGLSPGGITSTHTNVDRLNFATDAMARVPSADLVLTVQGHAGASSNTHAYMSGGSFHPWRITFTSKTSYSEDTTAAAPGADLTEGRSHLGATGNVNNGYFGGGYDGSGPRASTVDKMVYSTDTTSRIASADFPTIRAAASAAGNNSQGYFAGGSHPSYGGGAAARTSTINKLVYASETSSNITDNLVASAYGTMGVGDDTYGYFMGGSAGSNPYTETNRVTYSTDTAQKIPGADLPLGRSRAGTAGDQIAGYMSAGLTPSPDTVSSTYKITYSDETVSLLPSASDYSLTSSQYNAGTSARQNAFPGAQSFPATQFKTGIIQGPNNGYSTGGNIQTPTPQTSVSTVDKLDYATDTSSATTALSTGTRNDGSGVSNTTTGYVCQGRPDLTATDLSSVDKYTFSTDTSARGPSDTVLGNRSAGSFGNNDAGYLTGGNTPAESSATEKVTYSTDGIARVPSADLNQQAYWIAGFGNSDAGYAAGGWTPGSTSRIEKMSYASETYSTLPTTLGGGPLGALSAVKYGAGAFSNNDSGFISGGAPFPSANTHTSTDKFVFSTDTCSRVPGADLTAARAYLQGMNNSGVGFQAGGTTGTDHISTVEKMSFSTETYSINPGSNLSQGRYAMQNISSRMLDLPQQPSPTPTPQTSPVPGPAPETGYWGGGQPAKTAVDKITYSNDTTVRVPTANLNYDPTYVSAAGNGVAGYFAGGLSGGSVLTVDKLSYTADTTELVPGANLTQARYGIGAVANSTHGYFSGGTEDPGTSSKTDRLTFATDTRSEVPGAALSLARYYVTATGNTTAGYIGGGYSPAASPNRVTTVDKLTYATDTTAQVPGASLSTNLRGAGAAGNADQGYFTGGENGSDYISTTDKITYSNDTRSTIPGAAQSVPRNSLAGVSNPSSGYFSGGSPGPISTTDKMNFSNDTNAAVVTAKLSVARTELGACSARSNALPSVAGIPAPVLC